MKPPAHIVASGIISVFVGMYFKSLACGIASLVTGVCIDIDHLWDYYYSCGPTFNLRKIYDKCARMEMKKLFLVFHSYELLAAFWILIYLFSLSNLWKAIAIGLTQHILLDQLTNPIDAFGYFLTYRAMKKFDRNSLVKL